MDNDRECISGPSFWKKNMKTVPGRASAQQELKMTYPKAKSVASTSFQDFQESVNDAWDVDDECSTTLTMKSPEISKKVSQSAANNVLSSHRVGNVPLVTNRLNCLQMNNTINNIAMQTAVRVHHAPSGSGRTALMKCHTTLPDDENSETKLERFKTLLSNSTVNLQELRNLSWSGIPVQVRPIAWRLLSGYLPINSDRRCDVLERKRQDYWNLVEKYYNVDLDEINREIRHQIDIDVPRMNPSMALFQQRTVQVIFARILFIWSIRHPASGYVQGINDLVTPFFIVFLQECINEMDEYFEALKIDRLTADTLRILEADSFWCLTKFLDGIQDNYVFAQIGIQQKVHQLEELIKRVDVTLDGHLKKHNVSYLQFAFRWLNNLLTRELPLRCTIRLWDTYLSESDCFSSFQLYVCVAFLLCWRDLLMKQHDFQGLLLLLQNLPTQHWSNSEISLLVAEAYKLKVMFADCPNHLHNTRNS